MSQSESMSQRPGGGQGGPSKMVVTLRAGAALALANIICVVIFSAAWMHVKTETKSINVTGSAKKQITSDLIVWSAKVSAMNPDLVQAYTMLAASTDKTVAFLREQGVPESQMKVSAVGTWKRRAHDAKGNETETVVSYELWQNIEITSPDVGKIDAVARRVTELIKDGVMLESDPPKYLYTKLSDLKVEMLAEATKDAATRAQQIASNSGGHLGSILDAHMGVMQINPVHCDDVSGGGNNDTTSLQKEITAVVTARFSLQ